MALPPIFWETGQANTTVQLRSGQPYNFDVSGDVANIEAPAGDSWFTYERPNQVASPKLSHPTKNEAFNTAAFQVPAIGYLRKRRNIASLFNAFANTDMSLFKNFPIREQLAINLRAEVFNVFNIQNYGPPDTNVIQQDPSAGTITIQSLTIHV